MSRWVPTGRGRRARWGRLTALVLQQEHLHVVQASQRGGGARVVGWGVLPMELPADGGGPDPVGLGRAVGVALGEAGLGGGNVVMGVPQAQVMLRVLELPRADTAEEMAAMVQMRLGRELPFRLEEALIDFEVLPGASAEGEGDVGSGGTEARGTQRGGVRVLTAVIRRQTLEFYRSLAGAAGLRLVALGLRSQAGAYAARRSHPEASVGSVALVTLHRREVVFDVLREGALVFSRAGGLPALGEGEPAAEVAETGPLWLEVIRSLHSYEGQEGDRPVGRFLVAGATGVEAALAEGLGQRFGVPARVLAPWGEGDESAPRGDALPVALPAVGLALGALASGGLPIDFVAPKRPPVVRDTRRVRQLATVAAVAAVVLGAAGLRARWIGDRERVKAGLQDQIRLGSQNLGAFRQVRNQARTLREWTAGGRNWLDHLTLLSALLPPSQELYVTALSVGARNGLSLAVKVRSGETVDRLTAVLRGAGYEVKAPAIMPATDRYGFRFQANLDLEVPQAITNDLDALVVEARAPAGEAAPAPGAPVPSSSNPSSGQGAGSQTAAAAGASAGGPPAVVEASASEGQSRWPRGRRRRPEGGGND